MVTLDLEGREKRAGASARSLVRLGYQAWVGLAMILMLEPSNFQTIDEGFKFFPAAKNLAFFREKMKLTALSSSPNLVFHSSFLNCWIGIAFEPDQWELRPDIWLLKGEEKERLRFLVDPKSPRHIIVDAKEEAGWAGRKRKGGKTELNILYDYLREFQPRALYAVCWEREEGLSRSIDPKLKVLDEVAFEKEKLLPVIEELRR
jgi:hypothetical protein